ncbi:MAG: fibronectin type III domain-containing protein [Tepidisphaerales bacterium]
MLSSATLTLHTGFIRLCPTDADLVQVYASAAPTGTPDYTYSRSELTELTINGTSGDDTLTLDYTNGTPLKDNVLTFNAGDGNDTFNLVGRSTIRATISPSGTDTGHGSIKAYTQNFGYTDVESITASAFSAVTLVTPNADDTITLDRDAGVANISATSGNDFDLPPISVAANVPKIVLDLATHDGSAGDDTIELTGDADPTGFTYMRIDCGTGDNKFTTSAAKTTVQLNGSDIEATVSAGAELDFITHQMLGSLTLEGNAKAKMSAESLRVLRVDTLDLSSTAQLDLNASALMIQDANTTGNPTTGDVRNWLIAGRNAAGLGQNPPHIWDGSTGIMSSMVAQSFHDHFSTEITSLGLGDAADMRENIGLTFDNIGGVALGDNTVFVRPTRMGDASLDGFVANADVTIVSTFYGQSSKFWYQGDVNYDGKVGDADVTMVSTYYQGSTAPATQIANGRTDLGTYAVGQSVSFSVSGASNWYVYWMDDSRDLLSGSNATATHAYTDPGDYTIYVVGRASSGVDFVAGTVTVHIASATATAPAEPASIDANGIDYPLTLHASDDVVWDIDWGDTQTDHVTTANTVKHHVYTTLPTSDIIATASIDGVTCNVIQITPHLHPAEPTSLSGLVNCDGDINLTWTDNSAIEGGFNIEQAVDGGSFSTVATAAANATSITLPGPFDPGAVYSFRLVAFTGSALSDPTDAIDLTTTSAILTGTAGNDNWYIRRSPTDADVVQIYNAASVTGTPRTCTRSQLRSLIINAGAGDDTVTLDYSHGSPLKDGALLFNADAGQDTVKLAGGDLVGAAINPDPATAGSGSITGYFQTFSYTGVESISAAHLKTLTLVTPNPADNISINNSSTTTTLSGSSGSVAIPPIAITHTPDVFLDMRSNDGQAAAADSVTVSGERWQSFASALHLTFGPGSNTLHTPDFYQSFISGQVNSDGDPVDIVTVSYDCYTDPIGTSVAATTPVDGSVSLSLTPTNADYPVIGWYVYWTNDAAPEWLPASGLNITDTATHTYTADGHYTPWAVARVDFGDNDCYDYLAGFAGVDITGTAAPDAPAATGPTTSIAEGKDYTLTLSAPDGITMWTIDWSDGSAVQHIAWPTATPSLTHTYTSAPTGPISATATDDEYLYDAAPVYPDLLPDAPTTLTLTGTASGQNVTLAWTDNSDIEDGFVIEQADDSDPDAYSAVAFAPTDAEAFTVSGPFHPSTTYYFRVSALCGSTLSDPTDALDVLVPAVPEYPTDLTATVDPEQDPQTQITLAWTDNAADDEDYTVLRSDDGGDTWTTIALDDHESGYVDTGLDGNCTYIYRVYAANGLGNSGYVVASMDTGALPPTDVTATAISPVKVEVGWTAPSGTAATVYNVYESTNSSTLGTCVAQGVSETSYICTGLTPDTKYYFHVEADNASGVEALATNVPDATPVPPDAPSGFTAGDIGFDLADVQWTDNSTGEDGFEIEVSTGNEVAQVAVAGPDATIATLDQLSPQTEYSLRIRAVQDGVGSEWTGPLTITTNPAPPEAPVSLGASNIGTNSIALFWTDTSARETGFEVEYSANGLDFTLATTTPLSANTTTYALNGLDDGRQYTVRVHALNVSGPSDWCTEDFITHLIAPGSVSSTTISAYQAQLTWTNGSTAPDCAYAIETPSTIIYTTVGATSWIIGTTPNGNSSWTLDVSVKAINGLGSYADSEAVPVDVDVPQLGAPAAPSNLHVITRSGNLAPFLAWDYAGLPNDVGFAVEASSYSDFLDPDTHLPSFANIGGGGGYEVRALQVFPDSNNTTYYRVVASNSAGESGFSNVVSLAPASRDSVHPNIDAGTVSEAMEDLSGAPGLIIPVNDHDTDHDGIPDFADGYDNEYGQAAAGRYNEFPQVSLDLTGLASTDTITFDYTASDPSGITRTADGQDGYTYAPASGGGLRLWAVDGDDITTYIEADGEYTVQELTGMTVPNSEYGAVRRLYVEGVSVSSSMADQHITVTLNDDGPSDTLNITVAGVNLTAHRTGLNFGQPVTEQTENIGNPSDFVVLVNNDEEEDPVALRRDDEDDVAAISDDGDPDDDLVKITLDQVPDWLTRGLVQVILIGASANPWRVFDSSGLDITRLFSIPLIPEDSPCLAMDLSNPQGPLAGLKNGNVDLWLEGTAATSQATVLYQVQRMQGQEAVADDEVEIAIKAQPTIKSITYEVSYQGSNVTRETGVLDAKNPNGTNGEPAFKGGWRLFAEAITLAGRNTMGWNKVRVKVEVENVAAGDQVYFRAFDVDDPSEDPAIDGDPTGKKHDAAGNDNLGCPIGANLDGPADQAPIGGYAGRLKAMGAQGYSDANQEVASPVFQSVVDGKFYAYVTLATSFAPGDNFRVLASCLKGEVKRFQTDDPKQTATFVPTTGGLPGFQGMISDQLTIWRTFHIERDYMDANDAQGNAALGDKRLNGTVKSALPNADGTVAVKIDFAGIKANEYANGILRIGLDNYAIVGNTGTVAGKTTFDIQFRVGRDPVKLWNSNVDVYQDDFGAPWRDAQGELIKLQRVPITKIVPKRDWTGMWDLMKQGSMSLQDNPLAAAYVVPDYTALDGFSSDAVPAVAHMPEGSVTIASVVDPYRQSKDMGNKMFWVGYVLAGYEGPSDRDNDPDGEKSADGKPACLGLASSGTSAVVFLEVIRDCMAASAWTLSAERARARTTLHEVGHLILRTGEADHDNTAYNIMQERLPVGSTDPLFAPPAIISIRNKRD